MTTVEFITAIRAALDKREVEAQAQAAAVLRDVAADREILDEYAALYVNPERLQDPVLHLVYNLLTRIVRVRARGLGIDPEETE